MRFDTTALLGKRPSTPDMPADGAAAEFTPAILAEAPKGHPIVHFA
jgi:hypothetical protein